MADSSDSAGLDKKWAAAAALALVFVAVLYAQFRGSPRNGSSPHGSAARATQPHPPSGQTGPSSPSETPRANARQVPPWPILTRAMAQNYDPFAWPSGSASGAGDSTGRVAANSAQPTKFTSSSGSENSESLEDQAADRETRRMEHRRQRRQLLADLQRHGVAAVILRDDGNTALVGERRIRVGDVIDGFEVKQISRDGVVLVDQATDPAP